MKSIRIKAVIALLLLFSLSIHAQEIEHEAPTLQLGLDGLSFSKGTLDPEIISRIIAEKQNEIKIKIIQNSFLKNIYGSGGTIYNYADNIIKGVVEESDTDVRTRKILESTVNLVFVYTFADFYLKQVEKDENAHTHLKELAKIYGLNNLETFSRGLKYRSLRQDNVSIESKTKDDAFNGRSTKITKDDKNDLYQFIALLIDISSEVVRQDSKLKELGLMRISFSTNYEYLNKFKQLEQFKKFEENNVLIDEKIYNKAKLVKDDMSNFIKRYTSYIGAIKSLVETKKIEKL